MTSPKTCVYDGAMKNLILALTLAAATLPLVGATPTKGATPHKKEVLPFIADDYGKAVAQARAKNVPLFVEAWAPW